ncbi:membrane protein [Microbacterium shaanxiense]
MSITATRNRMTGIGRVLVIVYAVMALAATGRSFVQIVRKFDEAPLAYSLSAIAAVVYILATLALVLAGRRGWYTVAWVAILFELVGVVVVGVLSLAVPELFQHDSVWSVFGRGYLFIPLVLPVFGIWWLRTHRPVDAALTVEAKA